MDMSNFTKTFAVALAATVVLSSALVGSSFAKCCSKKMDAMQKTEAMGMKEPEAMAMKKPCCKMKKQGCTMMSSENLMQTAVDNGNFKTLTAALKATGLDEALSGNAEFTVFAPTDEAFAKLPAGTVEMLLLPENSEKLKKILTFHVVPGRMDAKQVTAKTSLPSLEGEALSIESSKGMAMVNKASIVQTDVKASNGIIHVIDTVLMPQ
jgi:uncharacterized surface protein with fasciclin (FAS1) repeats